MPLCWAIFPYIKFVRTCLANRLLQLAENLDHLKSSKIRVMTLIREDLIRSKYYKML